MTQESPQSSKAVKNVLVSVFEKSGLEALTGQLKNINANFFASGGTKKFLEEQGITVKGVEELTGYPSILGGRVKTLHPAVFGGILYRGHHAEDMEVIKDYGIPALDMVIVDLYPFRETLEQGGSHDEIIEKIDIGGISLIRAAAKNYRDVMVVPGKDHYAKAAEWLKEHNGQTTEEQRRAMAGEAFSISASYDSLIASYIANGKQSNSLQVSEGPATSLRYGENPHQEATFYGKLEDMLEQLNGKQLSYNNLVDVDAAVELIEDFPEDKAFGIIKHTNPCGFAIDKHSLNAWNKALEGDPVSAFGGIIVANHQIEKETAEAINELFYEILIAPGFTEEALNVLKGKKNRIILKKKAESNRQKQLKSILNGVLSQDRDLRKETAGDLKTVTKQSPDEGQVNDLILAARLVKHTKSNAIILMKQRQMIGNGTGQTSRVDALKQAIDKAKRFSLDPKGAVMASDAFFPFPDCVEIGAEAGIGSIIQPGGSKNDQASVDEADNNGLSMVFTGIRHFKH